MVIKKKDGLEHKEFEHWIPHPYRRDPAELLFYKHGADALDKFDGFIRLGKQRVSMVHNKNIGGTHVDVGMIPPPGCHLPPKEHRYGIVKRKGIYDNVPACIDEWQEFNTSRQLRMYAKEHRKRDNIAANMMALDCKISDPKNWNRFCMSQKNLYYFTPEHTQQSYKDNRKFVVPEREEKIPPMPHNMFRILSNDYAREWYRTKHAEAYYERNQRQIDGRMMGTKMNTRHAEFLARAQIKLQRRKAAQGHRGELKPLAAITPPKKVREAVTKLSTFREPGWSLNHPDRSTWHCAVPRNGPLVCQSAPKLQTCCT